jgi:amino acid adenylation domain-containing protein/thioester reductase-like protein
MENKEIYELTNPQKSIWATEQFFTGTDVNNIAATLTIKQNIELDTLEKAINTYLKNNKSFGLKFKIQEGKLVQYFTEVEEKKFEILNLKNKEELKKVATELSREIFNIEEENLFKYKLFKLGNGYGGFIIIAHHIISDAGTFSLMGTEIVDNYSKIKKNENIEIKEFSYEDYIKDEKEYEESSKFIKDKEYWNNVYKDIPEVATIPSIKSKANTENSGKSLREEYILNEEILNGITELCKKNKISNFNFFMAIYAIYLSRVSNLKDFVIGTPILNRTNFKEKHTTGMFINTAPLRIKIEENSDFISCAKQIAQSSLSMLRYQKYPYQMLLEDLRKKDSTIPVLFDIMLSYQVTKANDRTLEIPYEVEWLPSNTISDSIYIHLHDNDDNGRLNVAYDYQIEKYSKEDIDNMHKRILHIINQVLNNENCLEKDIEIVTDEEKNKILNEFNNTYVDYPRDKTIVDLFEEQVEKTPDNVAVICQEKVITYKELNEKANKLARYLINKGVTKNDSIGILVDRTIELIIAIIATIKANAIYIPIDPDYPEKRIKYVLENSKTQIVLTSDKTEEILSNEYKKINVSHQEDFSNLDKTNINNKIELDENAYMLYTSGSTGNPKGVEITHKNILNYIYAVNRELDFNSKKTMLSVTTVSFDIFELELYGSLLNGMKLLLASEKEQINSELLNKLCEKNNASIIQTTPSRILALLEDTENSNYFKSFTEIILAGEPFPLSLLRKLQEITKAKIYNAYGPTETTIWSTLKRIDNRITIGKPLANTTCYILDDNMNLLPINTPGCLYIGGDGVSKGYFNNKELTNNKFINFKYTNERIYNTNDLVYWNDEGELIHLGRLDFQIKLNGYRIDLEEIEQSILKYEEISNCVVIQVNGEKNKKQLYAYIISNKKIEEKELISYLFEILPTYMVPSKIIQIDRMPYTPNGKIDRKSLPIPEIKEKTNKRLPRNEDDKKILELVKKMLHTEEIDIEDYIFENGGDSLFAMSLAIQLSDMFNVELSIKDIYKNFTIEKLSNYIRKLPQNQKNIKITENKEKEFYNLSSAQKRIYYASAVDENSTLYNISGGIILENIPDIEKLEKSINILMERHSILRTKYEIINNEIMQKIEKFEPYKLKVRKFNTDKFKEIFKDFVKPFKLISSRLIRFELAELKDGRAFFMIDIHHSICDGTSLNILMNELCKIYNGEELEKGKIEYKDFAEWENKKIKLNKFRKSEDYWMKQFEEELPTLNLPTTFKRQSKNTFIGTSEKMSIDSNIVNKINEMAIELNCTPYMICLATYYILLLKYTDQRDIIVGTPITGRYLPELENVIGMFVNTLALRSKIKTEKTFRQYLDDIKTMCLNAYDNQEYPLEFINEKLNLQKEDGKRILFDTMFIFQNNEYSEFQLDGIKAKYYRPKSNVSKFDISLEIIPNKNKEFDMNIEYCTELFNREYAIDFGEHYIQVLREICENSEIKIKEINILTLNEKEKLQQFNDTNEYYEKDKSVIKIFEEQAKNNPEKTAIIFKDKLITYKELNEMANGLAKELLKSGIETKNVIGILLQRSESVIISMLAALKVGCAYMLIDPNLPNDRIEYMLEDSKAATLITQDTEKYVKSKNKIFIDRQINKLESNINISDSIENPFSIIYTSGSTGKPKGVMLKNQGVINMLLSYKKILNTDICNNFLSMSTVSFDMFMVETMVPLLSGKTIILTTEEEQKIPVYTSKLMLKHNVDFILTTPSRMELFLVNQLNECIEKVKIIQLGGEVFTTELKERLQKVTKANIYNGYGPTEITACCSSKKIEENISIGRPFCNTKIYVLNEDNNICPINVPGEICVAGDGVSLGYINKEELTQKVFIENPFGKGYMYKTGDIGQINKDNELIYVDRKDSQIKIRGLRVELSEIEKQILNTIKVKNCAVIYKKDKGYISAFICANEKINISDARKKLTRKLPLYMVPKYIVQIDEMPLTPNGKINKKILEKYKNEDIEIIEYVEPRTEQEKLFCKIWEKLLNKKIGIENDIFEFGADSLLAIKFKTELLAHNIEVSYSDLFKYKTIKSFCGNSRIKKTENDEKYDYTNINKILEKNNINNLKNIEKNKNNNVLLFGATGFVGMHIIDSFVKNDNGKIYCVVRDKNNKSAQERFVEILHFYFGEELDKYIGNRILILKGNILKENFELSNKNFNNLIDNVNIVINSAALVKHYGDEEKFIEINVNSTKNIIDFCNEYKKRLIQISSLSVSGNSSLDGNAENRKQEEEMTYTEMDLYKGQQLNNVYIKSKFIAERLILENISKGLDAQILRLGNITSRYKDGLFQINPDENAFANKIKSFIKLGIIPEYLLNSYMEFTPVDICANAIIKVIQNNVPEISVLHIYDNEHVYLNKFVEYLKLNNINMKIVNQNDFKEEVERILKQESENKLLEGIINDFDKDKKVLYTSNVDIVSEFTRAYLYKIGFIWPKIENEYMSKYFKYLEKVDFFDTK